MNTIRITKATLIEDDRPVYSKEMDVCCDRSQLEEMRSTIKAELVRELTKEVEVYLQYKDTGTL